MQPYPVEKKWIIEDIPPVYQILDLFPSLKKVKYVGNENYYVQLFIIIII